MLRLWTSPAELSGQLTDGFGVIHRIQFDDTNRVFLTYAYRSEIARRQADSSDLVGDAVLFTIAERLQNCVRETDTVARMGGDEFIVLLTDIQSGDAVSGKVEEMLAIMATPLDIGLDRLDMPTCSIGTAIYPVDGEDHRPC